MPAIVEDNLTTALEVMYGRSDIRTDRPYRQWKKLKDALRTVVRHKGRCRDLKTMAKLSPLDLETVMDNTDPDDSKFWAIALVYNEYETRIMAALEGRNRRQSALQKRVKATSRRNRLSIVGTIHAITT